MPKEFRYSEEELEKLLEQHNLKGLTAQQKLDILLNKYGEPFSLLVIDLAYHPEPTLITNLIETLQEDTRISNRAARVLGQIEAIDAIPALVTKLSNEKSYYDVQEFRVALIDINSPDLVIDELRTQLYQNQKLSLAHARWILKIFLRMHPKGSDIYNKANGLLVQIANIQDLSVGYIVSSDEMAFLGKLLKDATNSNHVSETYGSINALDKDTFDDLVFQLGVVEHYKDAPNGVSYSAPYYSIGKELWENSRKQIRDALCGTSEEYKEERTKLREHAENALIILIPMIMNLLNIPLAGAGVAVVLGLMVIKIGLKTLCATSGDLAKFQGKPGNICQTPGKYLNLQVGEIVEVFEGTRFPKAPEDSRWVFYEAISDKKR